MKCIVCDCERIQPARVDGFHICSACGFMYDKQPEDDYGKKKPKTKMVFMKSKNLKPEIVFAKAREKFEKGKWVVAAIKLSDKKKSLLFGSEFIVMLKKI